MFSKKCPKCRKKISKEYNFCPYCGSDITKDEEDRDFGFLGRDDFLAPELKMPFGFNKIFSSLLKQIDSQFKEIDKEIGKEKEEKIREPEKISRGLSISISSGTGKQPEIRVRGFGPGFESLPEQAIEKKEKLKKIPKIEISEEKARKLAKLPKEEALAKVRRLSNKIVYELDLPEVRSLEDITINQLENSIEIKAFSKDKVYFKLLPVSLPILNYKLEKGKLILELKPSK